MGKPYLPLATIQIFRVTRVSSGRTVSSTVVSLVVMPSMALLDGVK